MTLKIKSRSPVFELVGDLYVINIWFKFEDKIKKTPQKLSCSQGITQTMTEPKTMSPPGRGGGRHNYINLFVRNMYITEATFISQLHCAI